MCARTHQLLVLVYFGAELGLGGGRRLFRVDHLLAQLLRFSGGGAFLLLALHLLLGNGPLQRRDLRPQLGDGRGDFFFLFRGLGADMQAGGRVSPKGTEHRLPPPRGAMHPQYRCLFPQQQQQQ